MIVDQATALIVARFLPALIVSIPFQWDRLAVMSAGLPTAGNSNDYNDLGGSHCLVPIDIERVVCGSDKDTLASNSGQVEKS